jgi:Skp family chaperone for outer membrane proteins
MTLRQSLRLNVLQCFHASMPPAEKLFKDLLTLFKNQLKQLERRQHEAQKLTKQALAEMQNADTPRHVQSRKVHLHHTLGHKTTAGTGTLLSIR